MKFNGVNHAFSPRAHIVAAIVIAVAFLLAVVCVFIDSTPIAYAADAPAFDVIFPTNSYIQSSSPTLVAANDSYLLVYDTQQRSIFARDNTTSSTRVYPFDHDEVSDIFALGNSAFIACADGYFTIDLSLPLASAQQRSLPTPSNISYLNCDGAYLYAKSAAGYLSIYDSALSIAFSVENVYNEDFFTGKTVFTGTDGTVYVFTYDYGEPVMYTYNPQTGSRVQYSVGFSDLQQPSAGNVIFAKSTNRLVALSTQGETLFLTNITPIAFCSYGERLFTIENNQICVYSLTQNSDGVELNSTIGMSGSDSRHLDNPTDITTINNTLVIADKGNSRLAYVTNGVNTLQEVRLPNAPIALTSDSKSVYTVAEHNRLYVIRQGSIFAEYTLQGLLDITFADKLYLLTTDGVYTLIGGNFIKISDITGRRIACAAGGKSIYVLQDSCIAMLDFDGKLLCTPIGDLSGAHDIAIDYAGNIFAINDNSVDLYVNTLTTLQLKQTASINTTTIAASITSALLSERTLYFAASQCYIGATNIDATTKSNFIPTPAPQITEEQAYAFYKASTQTALALSDPVYTDDCTFVGAQTIIVFSNLTADNGMHYALLDNGAAYINLSDFQLVQPQNVSNIYRAQQGTQLYIYPDIEAGKITVDVSLALSDITDAAGFDNSKWYTVAYDEKTYFIKRSDVQQSNTPPALTENHIYGKAKAERVGGTVAIYIAADTSTVVLANIVDGTKIEILQEFDNFYQVRYGDTIGYMLSDTVQLSGLTSVQIIAIVLSLLVALIGVVVFVSISATRKKNEK